MIPVPREDLRRFHIFHHCAIHFTANLTDCTNASIGASGRGSHYQVFALCSSFCHNNVSLYPKRSVAFTPHHQTCICNRQRPLPSTTTNQNAEFSLNGYIYKILLYLRLRVHCGRWGRKSVRARGLGNFAVRFFIPVTSEARSINFHQLLPKWEQNKNNSNGPDNVGRG